MIIIIYKNILIVAYLEIKLKKGVLLFTSLEVATILKVHPVTVRRWIKNNEITFVKIGKCVRFRQADIDYLIFKNIVVKKTNGGENAI
jgi:excisionase family DNA binding protein